MCFVVVIVFWGYVFGVSVFSLFGGYDCVVGVGWLVVWVGLVNWWFVRWLDLLLDRVCCLLMVWYVGLVMVLVLCGLLDWYGCCLVYWVVDLFVLIVWFWDVFVLVGVGVVVVSV